MPPLSAALQSILDRLRDDLSAIRSGRATPALVENVAVEAYGASMHLKELAAITTPEPRQVLIQAWDRSQLKAVETALRAADLQLSVAVDGDRIRCTLPPMTEERRNEYRRLARDRAEQARIAVRQHRDELLRSLRDATRAGEQSEDNAERERKTVEQSVRSAAEAIDQQLTDKEAELTTV